MYREQFEFLKTRADSLSQCKRRKVAAMILDVGGTGENVVGLNCEGPTAHLCSSSCLRNDLGIETGHDPDACRGWHAEQAALLQAGMDKCQDKTILTTLAPCVSCAKWLIAAGIRRVVYIDNYTNDLGLQLLREAGVLVEQYKEGE